MIGRGIVISAPASGAGKTTITMGLLRALSEVIKVKPAKSGPDYIDPAFHQAACGVPSVNLDAWAMEPDELRANAATEDLLVVEGAMGLFDGAPPEGKGATADVARILGLPIILVVDVRSMSHSIAALVRGFRDHDPDLSIAGLILNRVGSPRHEAMLRKALEPLNIPVIGALPREKEVSLPSRHLGLVQAMEHPDLERVLKVLSQLVQKHIDINKIIDLSDKFEAKSVLRRHTRKRIAVAQDAAFSFTYTHDLARWAAEGELLTFSPLANEPVPEADEVFLPGGYPELFGGILSDANIFTDSIKEASQSIAIKGECGGYMTLGEAIVDAEGTSHKMAGLLPLVTSFEERKLHLGYRILRCSQGGSALKGHEFHYATTLRADGTPAFDAWDAEGNALAPMGLIEGNVSGSFAHIIA